MCDFIVNSVSPAAACVRVWLYIHAHELKYTRYAHERRSGHLLHRLDLCRVIRLLDTVRPAEPVVVLPLTALLLCMPSAPTPPRLGDLAAATRRLAPEGVRGVPMAPRAISRITCFAQPALSSDSVVGQQLSSDGKLCANMQPSPSYLTVFPMNK